MYSGGLHTDIIPNEIHKQVKEQTVNK